MKNRIALLLILILPLNMVLGQTAKLRFALPLSDHYHGLYVTEDGQVLGSAGLKFLKFWNIETGKLIDYFQPELQNMGGGMPSNANGMQHVGFTPDPNYYFWHRLTDTVTYLGFYTRFIDYSKDGAYFFYLEDAGWETPDSLSVLNTLNGTVESVYFDGLEETDVLFASPFNTKELIRVRFIEAQGVTEISIWDLDMKIARKRRGARLKGNFNFVPSASVKQDQVFVRQQNADGNSSQLRLVNLSNGQTLRNWSGLPTNFQKVISSPNEHTLYAYTSDGSIWKTDWRRSGAFTKLIDLPVWILPDTLDVVESFKPYFFWQENELNAVVKTAVDEYQVWDISRKKKRWERKIKSTTENYYLSDTDKLAFYSDGVQTHYLFLGEVSGGIKQYKLLDGTLIKAFEDKVTHQLSSGNIDENGKLIIRSGEKVWEIDPRLGRSKQSDQVSMEPNSKVILEEVPDVVPSEFKIINKEDTLANGTLIGKGAIFSKITQWGAKTVWRLSPSGKYAVFYENISFELYKSRGPFSPELWDVEKGTLIGSIAEITSEVSVVQFSPDESRILIGLSEGPIYEIETSNGELISELKGHQHSVRSLRYAEDNQFAISTTSREYGLKLWDLEEKSLLATLYMLGDQEWVVTTPGGLFDASARANDLLYYVVGDEIVELDQLKARYYEPDLLSKLLGYNPERIRPVEDLEEVKLYPKVEAKIEGDHLLIALKARNGGIGKVSIFINGKEIIEEANPKSRVGDQTRAEQIKIPLQQFQNYLLKNPGESNTIQVRAYNEEGWLKSPPIEVPYRKAKGTSHIEEDDWEGEYDPKLYVISIGTSDYTGTKLDLRYADQDATLMARAMAELGGALFHNGDSLAVYSLTTANGDSTGFEGTVVEWQFANKPNIEKVFTEVREQAKAEDIIVVYLSGHGVSYASGDQSQFHYLTQGIASEDLSDAAIRRAYTISSEELTKWINAIPALKQVLIIDACNSGQIIDNLSSGSKNLNSSQVRALDRMKDRTGMFILSGSASDKVSYEAGEYGQGLLTYALLQGMLGVAVRKTAGGEYIDVMKLFQYARDEVPRLAESINGIQRPMLGFPNEGASFDIGLYKEGVALNLATKKPVLVKSNFMNLETLKDDLRFEEGLEFAFRKETEKGASADFIYVDVADYPNAYSLGGFYQKDTNGLITLRVKLFHQNEAIDLDIEPKKEKNQIIRQLLREIKKRMQ